MSRPERHDLPARPRLKPWYRVAELEDGVAVEYGESVLRFGGKAATTLMPLLLPLLDGMRTRAEIADALGERAAPAVENVLGRLTEHGLLVDGAAANEPRLLAATAGFCAAQAGGVLDEAAVERRLRDAVVLVAGTGTLAAELLRILRLSGVGEVRPAGWDDTTDALCVAAVAPEELNRLPEWNRSRLESGGPWLQLLPFNGRRGFIGPLYVPFETACYACFCARRASNIGYAEEFWSLERADATWPSTPAVDAVLAGAAAWLVLRWLLAADPLLPGRFLAVALDDALDVTAHVVQRVPRCHACSDVADVANPLPWGEAA